MASLRPAVPAHAVACGRERDYREFRDLHGKGLVLLGRVAEFFNGSEYKAVILQDCGVVGVFADSVPEQSRERSSATDH